MTGEGQGERVRALVENLFGAAGVPCGWRDGCLLADLSQEAMSELEGRWAQPATLLLAFSPETVAVHPEADLVAPGSFRLERFLSWIRRKGRLSQGYLPPVPRGAAEGALRRLLSQEGGGRNFPEAYVVADRQEWETHLLVGFVAARVGVERRESIHVPGMNLVTGAVRPDYRPALAAAVGSPQGPERRRRMAYRKAYLALLAGVVEELSREDAAWAAESLRRYEEEAARLGEFYDELRREARDDPEAVAQVETHRARRLREQKDRFRPRALVRPFAAALLHVPVVHLSVLVADGLGDRRRVFTYDALEGAIRLPAAPQSPPSGPEPQRPPTPPPGFALRPPEALARWRG